MERREVAHQALHGVRFSASSTSGQRATMSPMPFVLAITRHTGRDLAEVGFLLMVIGGVWLAATQLPQPRWRALRTIVAGVALAAGGVLLIIATHWGHFG